MNELIAQFPEQLKVALQIGKDAKLTLKGKKFDQVYVSGLGGSGIGASLVQDYVSDKLSIPFVVNKNYHIAKSVNKNTLFIACSYSGNTEETLEAVSMARAAKATIVCITSGGALDFFARKHGIDLILIPSGMPPRACLGYSVTQILYTLQKAGLLKKQFEAEYDEAIAGIEKLGNTIHKKATALATKLPGRELHLYSTAGHEGLTVRFRQQLNENAKVVASHNIIPEMTHNEIVGWRKDQKQRTVIFISSPQDYAPNLKRMAFLKKVVRSYGATVIEISLHGKSYWYDALLFIHLTDWISAELAVLNQQDAAEVKVIDKLKAEMAKK